ncbi:hypothetical protein BDN70DRAFT_184669 [Pholiota conissans]|uniref:C2H2-type domain-containing protein n=1 Tax=Pholiota conissans TaxID=109636 RepID=A0A9P6CQU6_9AGAR|nr:hypothetical protein BDN70DRAFT_184669 [Pholiota conissans]
MPVDHFCLTCSKTFASINGLNSHARAKRHTANPFFCEECDVSFISNQALQSHTNSTHSYDFAGSDDSEEEEPYCNGCERLFVNMYALNQHLFASPKHNWCFDCSRDFASESSLVQHQNSLAHEDRNFKCPFCNGMFKSPSGVALHIESGCHTITRHQVTAAISVKRITGPVQPPTTHTTYIATEASFDGTKYECILCTRRFDTLRGLNAHLNSPAHDDEEFRCPKCRREFTLISGFVQHLESRVCGFAKPAQINGYYANLTDRFSGLLTM